MSLQQQLDQMGRSYRIEAPHTEQVTRLALAIFDGFAPWPGLKPKDREILMAAGRLHDIGYASDPENHVEEGLRILQENPLPEFSSKRWKMVLAVVSMHRRNWRSALKDKRFAGLSENRLSRAKALAAILRIGDGLDHSHVQDARIVTCGRGRREDQIEVECGWYAGNISWAEGKADLWKVIFGRPLCLKGSVMYPDQPYSGMLDGNESAVVAARRILYAQYVIMRDQLPNIREKQGPEPLHIYRRALHRFRAALALFKPVLENTSALQLDEQLGQLNDLLGPLRDIHALQELADAHPEIGGVKRIRSHCRKAVSRADKEFNTIIDSAPCRNTVRLMNFFLRTELPALEGNPLDGKPFFEERLGTRLKKLKEQDVEALLQQPEQLHPFRKKCRSARYMAECAVPAVGAAAQDAVKTLKRMDDALGRVHDLYQCADALNTELPAAARSLISFEREDALRRFSRAWRKWTES